MSSAMDAEAYRISTLVAVTMRELQQTPEHHTLVTVDALKLEALVTEAARAAARRLNPSPAMIEAAWEKLYPATVRRFVNGPAYNAVRDAIIAANCVIHGPIPAEKWVPDPRYLPGARWGDEPE